MISKPGNIVALMLTVFALSACYPSILVSQPEMEIIVTDESGVPLQGVTITLGTVEWHGTVAGQTLQTFSTDGEGKVEIEKKHVLAFQSMGTDGGKWYSWSLCVAKPGFEAIPARRLEFDHPMHIAMYASGAKSGCTWFEGGFGPRVKEREARWIEVEGGKWQSNLGVTLLMDELIRPAAEAAARAQGRKLRSWSEYRFQHQPRGTGIDPHLYVRAFCEAPEEFDLRKDFHMRTDGGTCFFETTFLNAQGTFAAFRMNPE